jgi:chromate transporter
VSDEPAAPAPVRPRLAAIAWLFTRYANLTFGGGSATVAVLREQLVTRRRWMSRLTPGTNLLAFCTAAGWTARRGPGALVALLASSLPCSILAVIVSHFYEVWQRNPIVLAALHGAMAAAVAIMFSTAWTFAQAPIKAAPLRAAVIVPGALALSWQPTLSPVRILLLAALVGLAWPVREEAA